jgi:hypothetical protein
VLPPVRQGDDLVVRAAELDDELQDPEVVLRKQPLGLDPVEVRETIRVVLPGKPDLEDDVWTVDTAATRFRRRIHVEGRAIVTDLSYRTVGDRVAPEGVPAFTKSLREMRRAAGASLPLALARRTPDAPGSRAPVAAVLGGLALFGAALFGVFWLADGGASRLRLAARRRAFARKLAHGTGDSPQTALSVGTREDLDRAVARARCGCGGALAATGPLDTVRFGGRELAVVPLACGRCGAARALYAAWLA